MAQKRFDINNSNIRLIDYKEGRLTEEVRVATRIEQDQADQLQALKNQGIAPFGQAVRSISTQIRQKIAELEEKVARLTSGDVSLTTAKPRLDLAAEDRRAHPQDPAAGTESVAAFFDTLRPAQQDEFLSRIEVKANRYEAEKYRHFLAQAYQVGKV